MESARVVSFGTTFQQRGTVRLGTFAEFGDAVVVAPNGFGETVVVWVVPEPGTALLLGLGLLGLARRGVG